MECAKRGKYVRATVVDHIKPHRGDQKLFWDNISKLVSENYGVCASEVAAVSAMQLYLCKMEADEALARIERIYMPNVLRIESGELVPVRSHIDGAKYASFIDEAVVSTMQEVGERRGVAAEKVMEELKGINGKHMVERASVEFMSFVEDVYILLRKD